MRMRKRRLVSESNHVPQLVHKTMPNLSQFFPKIQKRMVYAHAQTCPKIQPLSPVCSLPCQTCRSSFLKYRKGWFMRMRILSLNPVYASLYTTMPNLSQFFPEIQNRIVYEHAHAQTFPEIQPRGPTRTPQCQLVAVLS
jgi:hypothetical protein